MEPVTLNWVAGEDEFLLRLGELEALDDATPDGVLDLRYRLSLGKDRGTLGYAPVRVRETIDCLRLGLIGAGMERKAALKKVERAFEDADISALNLMAYEVITRSVSGKAHDQPGEVKAAARKPRASASAKSTVQGSDSATRRKPSSK